MEEKIEQLHEKIHYLNKKLIAQEEELEKITQAYNYALEKCNENAKTIKNQKEIIEKLTIINKDLNDALTQLIQTKLDFTKKIMDEGGKQ